MSGLPERLKAVRARIRAAEQRYGRAPGSVTLLAVSKQQSTEAIREALRAGQKRFGESYAQEAVSKMAELVGAPIEWHFIGPLQGNKTRAVATRFDWVHSVDRLHLAERLSTQRPASLTALNVCVQINVSAEPSKRGVALREVAPLARALLGLPGLRLRGLMAIPAPSTDFAVQRVAFRMVHRAFRELCEQGVVLDTLSLGMSDDFEAAIAEGSTLVRIGTAIFGPREARAQT